MTNKGKIHRQMILGHLLAHGTMTTIEARAKGIMSPAPRVMELRRAGWPIGFNWYEQADHAGLTHRQGQYYLHVEKLDPEQIKIREQVS